MESSVSAVHTFGQRIWRAARLEPAIYEEVEADKSATGQALVVVILSSIAAALGLGMSGPSAPGRLLFGLLAALGGWVTWAVLIYWVGARWFPEPQTQSDVGELLRTVGFANSPGLLRALGVFVGMQQIVFVAVNVWLLISTVIAVRQALDYRSTWRAIGVCCWGWAVQLLLVAAVWIFFGYSA